MNEQQVKVKLTKLFRLLDIVEESENGNPFHPNIIRSCRALDGAAIDNILADLKKWAVVTTC
jgi:hypothetical protein